MAKMAWATFARSGDKSITVRKTAVAAFCPHHSSPAKTLVWLAGIAESIVVDESPEDVARALGAL